MRVLWISLIVIGLDQATKWLVLELMYRHQSISLIGDWLRFTFTENPGMAFGIQFGPPGTVALLAVLATGLVIYYIVQVRALYLPYRASLAFILGGAIGNIIDRVFYGVWLGYGGLFEGRVVDFIHVSLWQGFVHPGVPLIGGSYMELFPIWNVADMAIVLGVVGVLFFHNAFYEEMLAREQQGENAVEQPTHEGEAHSSSTERPASNGVPPAHSADANVAPRNEPRRDDTSASSSPGA